MVTRVWRAAIAALMAAAFAGAACGGSPIRPVPAGSTTPPPPRSSAAVAFDEARGVMVLFGGNSDQGTGPRADTWTFDGKLWVQQKPSSHPQGRTSFAMAYDQARHNVVLFGGMAQVGAGKGGVQAVDDTWIWNGTTWKEMHPAHEPAFIYDWGAPQMQFDPISRTVLTSGYTKSTEPNMAMRPELWSWDGADWKQLLSPTDGQAGATMMGAGDRVLLVGAGTWAWSGSAWTELNPRFNIPADPIVSNAYDPQRHQLVVLDGGDTWVWDGSTWARQHPSLQPPTMGYMAYVPALHEVVSWADVTSGFNYGMFAWDGTDWKQISPATVVAPETGGKGGYAGVMPPDRAASLVRSTVTNSRPVLLPGYLPSYIYDARVSATPDFFSIRYQSDERDKEITFGIIVANPPPGTGDHASDTKVKFRNSEPLKYSQRGYAEYFVYDTTDPHSARWLTWIEPGTMADPQLAGPGVPYSLSATGLTDAEFWQVANSLR
jgi:hypothetical protein